MEGRSSCMRLSVAIVFFIIEFATLIDARLPMQSKPTNDEQFGLWLETYLPLSPLDSSLAPSPLPFPFPANSPPFCVNPPSPFTPQTPSPPLTSHNSQTPPPPPPPPSPTSHNSQPPPPPSPPPPQSQSPVQQPSPPKPKPKHAAGPPKHNAPTPPSYKPPVACPPPLQPPPSQPPPPPQRKPQYAVWCVAKPTVPDTIIQEALDYACGSGADCKSIQPNGPCFLPNTLFSHASYAFNSYWQMRKNGGGTCDFGGTAMLVTVDPSYNNCYYICN